MRSHRRIELSRRLSGDRRRQQQVRSRAGYLGELGDSALLNAPRYERPSRGDYTKVTYLHGKGERIANVTRQVGS
jgi:hypothetical protein